MITPTSFLTDSTSFHHIDESTMQSQPDSTYSNGSLGNEDSNLSFPGIEMSRQSTSNQSDGDPDMRLGKQLNTWKCYLSSFFLCLGLV